MGCQNLPHSLARGHAVTVPGWEMSHGSRRPPVKLRREISNGCRKNRVQRFSFGGSQLPQGRGYSPRIEIGRHSTSSATFLPNGKREFPAVAAKFEKIDFRENPLRTKKIKPYTQKQGIVVGYFRQKLVNQSSAKLTKVQSAHPLLHSSNMSPVGALGVHLCLPEVDRRC